MSVLSPLLNTREYVYLGYLRYRGEHTSLKRIITNVREMLGYNGYDIVYNIHAIIFKICKFVFVYTLLQY